MHFQQCMIVFNAILDEPGMNIDELADKIGRDNNKESWAIQFMFLEDRSDKGRLVSIIKDLYCVEEKDGRYYFSEELPVKDVTDITQILLNSTVEAMLARNMIKEGRRVK